jgi:hypothetical protein
VPCALDLPRLYEFFAAHAGQEYVADAVGLNVVASSSNRRLGHLRGNNLQAARQAGRQAAVSANGNKCFAAHARQMMAMLLASML